MLLMVVWRSKKQRFVARGFTQNEGIDYDETFALVSRYTTIRTIISLAAAFWMEATSDGCKDDLSQL